jgi:Cysteine-rich secretory protein family
MMFHVKNMLFLLFVLVATEGYSQGVLTLKDKPFSYTHTYDTALIRHLEANKTYSTLSVKEKDLFYWTNYFRKDPRRFYETIVVEFLKQFPEAKSTYTKSLEADIKKAPVALSVLLPDNGLLTAAHLHASDLIKRGNVLSHNSSSGKNFVQRLQESGRYSCGAENVYIGSFNALESLIALLIDNGVPDKGHRMNLLDPKFKLMGVSFQSAGAGKGLMVQDFACP